MFGLIHESPILFLPSLAKALENERLAIMLQQLHFLLTIKLKDRQYESHIVDGRMWLFNTHEQWQEHFTWLNKRQIQEAFVRLEEMGVVLRRQDLNIMKFDRTMWYSIDYERLEEIMNISQTCTESALSMVRNYVPSQGTEKRSMLPESTSESTEKDLSLALRERDADAEELEFLQANVTSPTQQEDYSPIEQWVMQITKSKSLSESMRARLKEKRHYADPKTAKILEVPSARELWDTNEKYRAWVMAQVKTQAERTSISRSWLVSVMTNVHSWQAQKPDKAAAKKTTITGAVVDESALDFGGSYAKRKED